MMKQLLSRAAATALSVCVGVSAAALAQIETTNVDSSAFALGTLTPGTGALGRTLWQGADADTVSTLLATLPQNVADPMYLELLRRITLSPGEGPVGADNALAGAKFMAAAESGFYRDAASLAAIVPGLRTEPALAKVVAYAELYDGQTDQACARGAGLRDGRTDPFWIKLRFVCYVRAKEISAAELTLELLRRQGVLSTEEDAAFAGMVLGEAGYSGGAPATPLEFALMREAGAKATSDMLAVASPGTVAALARDLTQDQPVREAALLLALSQRTIGIREGRQLVETMPTSLLAADLLTVAAQTKGSLEQAQAIGGALSAARGDWTAFQARALLLSQDLPFAEPVVNFAPAAEEIAIAAMINGQDAVVEKWVMALAGDANDPDTAVRAAELVTLYSLLNPGAARRLGSYLNYAFTPPNVPAYVAPNASGPVDLARFVSVGLNAARADGEALPALVFLTGRNVAVDDANAPVRDTVVAWARDRAHLDWLDREAAFRLEAASLLQMASGGATPVMDPRFPTPRVKPSVN